MIMQTRETITIDEAKCNGCGHCVAACTAGTLAIASGKAVITSQEHCEGLADCIGECPVDAIHFIKHAVDGKSESQTLSSELESNGRDYSIISKAHINCLNKENRVQSGPDNESDSSSGALTLQDDSDATSKSELSAWPIQLHLVDTNAAHFKGADVLIAAACSAFVSGNFHAELLKRRPLIILCPKLDQLEGYVKKLANLFEFSEPSSVTVARMSVPCCKGVIRMTEEAHKLVYSNVPIKEVVIELPENTTTMNNIPN